MPGAGRKRLSAAGPRVGFLIVGAQKCGTTALAASLAAHPGLSVAPGKEVHFFDDPDRQGADWATADVARAYARAFPGWEGQSLAGEATPIYLYLPRVPAAVRRYNEAMRIVVVVREPGARACSQYRHEVRLGRERRSFYAALALEAWRLRTARGDLGPVSPVRAHSYLDRGRYARQIARWLDVFPSRQVLVLRHEDLWTRHDETLRRVFAHLGVPEPRPLPPRACLNRHPGGARLPRGARHVASWLLRPEVGRLERLLGWDLSSWRRPAQVPAAGPDSAGTGAV